MSFCAFSSLSFFFLMARVGLELGSKASVLVDPEPADSRPICQISAALFKFSSRTSICFLVCRFWTLVLLIRLIR
ncbi:hypothetical protein SDJN03_26568, partial [Cucurbita argyrosperma subsp. sororia]